MKNIAYCLEESNKEPLNKFNLTHRMATGDVFVGKIKVNTDGGCGTGYGVIIDFEMQYRYLDPHMYFYHMKRLIQEINDNYMIYDMDEKIN